MTLPGIRKQLKGVPSNTTDGNPTETGNTADLSSAESLNLDEFYDR